MTFEKALDQTVKKLEDTIPGFRGGFVTKEGLEAAILTWNMIALAMAEKGLDDFIIINNNIRRSIPLKPLKQEKPEKDEDEANKKGKGKSPKPETATDRKVDVKAKEQTDPTATD